MKVCPTCSGARRVNLPQGWWGKFLHHPPDTESCSFCDGYGEVAESSEEEQQRLAGKMEFQRRTTELDARRRLERQQQEEQRKKTHRAAVEAQSGPLSDDEFNAREVYFSLLMLQISWNSTKPNLNEHYIKIRSIGDELNRSGGLDRMQLVGNLVCSLAASKEGPHTAEVALRSANLLRTIWNGIGQWRN
jgi:hypothetical protein